MRDQSISNSGYASKRPADGAQRRMLLGGCLGVGRREWGVGSMHLFVRAYSRDGMVYLDAMRGEPWNEIFRVKLVRRENGRTEFGSAEMRSWRFVDWK